MADTIARAMAHAAKMDQLSVRDFGAKGNGTNDTEAFKACAAALMSSEHKGKKRLYIPPGDYALELAVNEVLFDFNGWSTVEIIGDGASLVRNNNPFSLRQAAYVFKFTNCKNVTIKGITFKTAANFVTPNLVDNPSGTDYGWTCLHFFDGNENIRIEQVHAENNFHFALFGDKTNWRSNRGIYIDASAYRCEYGLNFANSGDDAVIKFRGELCHRAYFVYGVRNHAVELAAVRPRTSSALISAYDYDTVNINLRATLYFDDTAESWNRSNGSVELMPQTETGQTKAGNIKRITVDLMLIDTGTILTGYRPIFNYYAFQGTGAPDPGYLDEITVRADIRKWRGHTLCRSPIGLGEISGYDTNGVAQYPTISDGVYLEPVLHNMTLENIVIHSDKLHANQQHSLEFSFSKLHGTFTLRNFDGNMSPSVRNVGTTGRVVFENINVNARFGKSWQQPSLNREWMKNSRNHVVRNVIEEVPSVIPAGNLVRYSQQVTEFSESAASNGSLFVDTADGKLKYKNYSGVVTTLT
ncbi:glycosyl hydrolase family 28-related protein [Paenibacillus hodogayensis]|uniref:Glycosyl hydrolase family 28-related protein n=1 Tax=Paenibacillus hodogayensis TaxID=279208 RepID=A0ABV5VW39_9BACL